MLHKEIIASLQKKAEVGAYYLPGDRVDVKKLLNEYYSLVKQP